ncbi:MAG: hypothetical protein GYB65_19265 [Chloroflexi bacterium]|nr:hypothetical protein [Chloroflexota bacterium]
MAAKVQQGQVIFRQWDKNFGLEESAKSFSKLDDLFRLCLQASSQTSTDNPLSVDRVIIEGTDPAGQKVTVTLVFQAITLSEQSRR